MKLLIATRNVGKLREFEQMLAGFPVDLVTLDAFNNVEEVEETGSTFEANARLKASGYARQTGCWTVAEDSGLVVDALGGEPGVHSARYAGRHGDDDANNHKLIQALAGVANRSARYVASLVLSRPDGSVVAYAQGVCEGSIVDEPRGKGGFGYDPYFVASGEARTNAELHPNEKHAISHRGQGLRSFLPLLRAQLGLARPE